MTSLVLGAAGGIVGGLVGGTVGAQVGFLLGSLIGNLIDPPKVEGPKRSDLKLQHSEYGRMYPFVWGTGRIAGAVIEQTDLEEHKETSGGKGGPEVTSYTYSASFAIGLAAAKAFNEPAIAGIKAIYADGRLIWDDTSGETLPCTVYLGTEDQLPDPTFEAIHGIGQQPAYRGIAYVVFTDYMLTEFGDRIPLFEFVVFTKAGVFPWRVSDFNPDTSGSAWGTYWRAPAAEFSEGTIRLAFGWRASSAAMSRYEFFDIYGNVAGTAYEAGPPAAYTGFGFHSAKNLHSWSDGTIIDPSTGLPEVGVLGISDLVGLIGESGAYEAALVPSTFATVMQVRVACATFVLYTDAGGFQYDGFTLGTSNVVQKISGGWSAGGITYHWLYVYNGNSGNHLLYELLVTIVPPDGITCNVSIALVRTWDMTAEYGVLPIFNGSPFVVYKNRSGYLVLAVDRGNTGNKQVYCYYLNDDLSTTAIGGTDYGNVGMVTLLGRGPYVLTGDGVISLEPPDQPELLSTIVGDLSDMTSVAAYDVTELTDEVRWFALGAQSTIRNALDPLRKGFQFDAVESDDTVVFRKRGATDSLVTIPDDDLVSEDGRDLLETTRKKEQGLPRTVTMRYIDVDMDYQTGAQSSPRLTTLSDSDVSLDLPIGFTASEALQKCWTLQVSEWIERETFSWSTSRKYAWLEPCDVCTVRGRVIRITKRTDSPAGSIKWEGVLHRPSVYTQEQTGEGSGGFTTPPPTPPGSGAATQAVLLDIPLLTQGDAPYGFYAAMGPASDASWGGATLYKSLDGGTTYTAVASTNVAAVIGFTADEIPGSPVGSPLYSGTLGSYSGGDVVDESSITVYLNDDDATLTSCTATALDQGANLCAIGRGFAAGSPGTLDWELLQFRDATLISARTYVLSGFKRGRYNTLTTGHATGDTFVVLPTVNVTAPQNELNLVLTYKAVTYGQTLGDATAFTFQNTGRGWDSYIGTIDDGLPPFTGDPGSPGGGTGGQVPAPPPGSCSLGYYLDACGNWSFPLGNVPFYVAGTPPAGLSQARVLVPGTGITFTDGGGSPPTTTTISAASAINGPVYAAGPVTGVSEARVLVAGTGITFTDGGGSPPTSTTISTSAAAASPQYPVSTGEDGNLTSSGTTTLSRDMYYDTITLTGAGTVITGQWVLHAKVIDLTGASANAITSNGSNGGNASGQTGGSAGAAIIAQTVGVATAGTAGGTGNTGAGTQGGAPTQPSPGNGGRSNTAGAGGIAAGGNNTGRVGTIPVSLVMGTLQNPPVNYTASTMARIGGGAGGPGGTSGAGDGSNLAGGGGGGGSGGNVLAVYCGELRVTGAAAGAISSKGGNAGNGASPPTGVGNTGGGGGGSGGGGGWIYIVVGMVTGTATDLIDASGGNGGTGANGVGTAGNGTSGSGGDGGRISYFNISANTASRTAGSAGSGVTGGACKLSL